MQHASLCPQCRYDLTGLEGQVCPECGCDLLVQFQGFTQFGQAVLEAADALAGRCQPRQIAERRSRFLLFRIVPVWSVEPLHLLVAVASGPEGVGRAAIQGCCRNPGVISPGAEGLLKEVVKGEVKRGPGMGALPWTPEAMLVLRAAAKFSSTLRQGWVGTGHLLLGLLDSENWIVRNVFREARVEVDAVMRFVSEQAPGPTE